MLFDHIGYAHLRAGVFVTINQCRPVSGAWNFTIDRKCIDYISYLYASSAVNVATDILLCVLPLPHLWRLNMPLKQRIILCVLLAGGARYVHLRRGLSYTESNSACVVGIVRIAFLHNLRVLDTTCKSALNPTCRIKHLPKWNLAVCVQVHYRNVTSSLQNL